MKKHYFRAKAFKVMPEIQAREILHHSQKFYTTHTHMSHTYTWTINKFSWNTSTIYNAYWYLLFYFILFHFTFLKIIFPNSVNLFYDPRRAKPTIWKPSVKKAYAFQMAVFWSYFFTVCVDSWGGGESIYRIIQSLSTLISVKNTYLVKTNNLCLLNGDFSFGQ